MVGRTILRPDLYGENGEAAIDEVDQARAQEYALLSALLARTPDAALLKALTQLKGDATPLGIAHVELAQAATQSSQQSIEREFFNLFIGVGRGELLPYGSYYLTGFLHERPLARLREDLMSIGIERSVGNKEPEDHAALLCEIMSGLAAQTFSCGRRHRPTHLRTPCRALDRPLLRRSRTGAGSGFLPARWDARPDIRGN